MRYPRDGVEFFSMSLFEATFADLAGTVGAAFVHFGGEDGGGEFEDAVGDVAVGGFDGDGAAFAGFGGSINN